MITAIDTNILLDIPIPNDDFCSASSDALENAVSHGALIICDIWASGIAMPFWPLTRSAFRL
jgi:hypothetical protein